MNFEEYLKQEFGLNEPIYVGEIQFEGYSRSWIFMQIKKLVDSGVLKRFDIGIYYFPIKFPFGDSSLDPYKIVEKRFLSDGDIVYGYVSGLAFENSVGLTTQCPAILEIVTNNESSNVRDIKVGKRRVRLRKPRTKITKENSNALQFLDLMNIINPKFMNETEQFMLKKYIKDSGVTRSQIKQYVGLFPKNAVKNFIESGAVFEITK